MPAGPVGGPGVPTLLTPGNGKVWEVLTDMAFQSAVCGESRRPAFVATMMGSLRSRRNLPTSRSLWPSPYTSAVSIKLTPRSIAR